MSIVLIFKFKTPNNYAGWSLKWSSRIHLAASGSTDIPSLKQRHNAFVLDFHHVCKTHVCDCIQCLLAHKFFKRLELCAIRNCHFCRGKNVWPSLTPVKLRIFKYKCLPTEKMLLHVQIEQRILIMTHQNDFVGLPDISIIITCMHIYTCLHVCCGFNLSSI